MCKNKNIKRLLAVSILAVMTMGSFVVSNALSEEKQVEFTVPDTTKIESNTNRHTQPEAETGKVNSLGTEGYVKMMENDKLEVWFREECQGIRVVDRRSGYVWGSIESDKVEGLNKNWSGFANAICSVEYFNEKGADKRVNLNDSAFKTKYKWDDNKMTCDVSSRKLGLKFSFSMELEEDTLAFAIDGPIEDGKKAKIKSVYFIPMFGCTVEDTVDGYMFVPDGCGALIRYKQSASYISGFEKRVYGLDMGIDSLSIASDLSASRTNDYLVDEKQVTFPVFGVVHGSDKNAIMTVIESAEEYASIVATPAGINTDYNWVTARFDYRQMYTQPSGNGDVGVPVPMENQNEMSPAIRVTFLVDDEANYSGMANRYRETLIAAGQLGEERTDEQVPMRLNVIGAEVKKQFLVNKTETFTTVEETEQIIKDLKENGITNLSMVYEGWQKGGLNGHSYGTTSFESKLGNQKEFLTLQENLIASGGRMYLQTNPVTAT